MLNKEHSWYKKSKSTGVNGLNKFQVYLKCNGSYKNRISRAGSDVRLMFIAYNLRRIGNILTIDVLKEYLKTLASSYFAFSDLIRGISEVCDGILFHGIQMPVKMKLCFKTILMKPDLFAIIGF